jgi:histidyl-tRNA synthetase
MFRHERPQKGRYREFHQIGAEILGTDNPLADAEIIKISDEILKNLQIPVEIHINSIGCKKCRPAYKKALKEYLESKKEKLCEDCQRRLNKNPLRILDCKVDSCRVIISQAPKITDFLCEECRAHYETVKNYLSALGVKYRENPYLVRGLDYYTKTVFECISKELGKTVLAGGRYDYLVEELGGPPTPALGFAVGVDRLILLLDEKLIKTPPLVFIIPFGGEEVKIHALQIASHLRKEGIRTEVSYREGKLKKLFEFANKIKADYVIVVGEKEIQEKIYPLKDLHTRQQQHLTLEEIIKFFAN